MSLGCHGATYHVEKQLIVNLLRQGIQWTVLSCHTVPRSMVVKGHQVHEVYISFRKKQTGDKILKGKKNDKRHENTKFLEGEVMPPGDCREIPGNSWYVVGSIDDVLTGGNSSGQQKTWPACCLSLSLKRWHHFLPTKMRICLTMYLMCYQLSSMRCCTWVYFSSDVYSGKCVHECKQSGRQTGNHTGKQ